jgi:hypothetical protein
MVGYDLLDNQRNRRKDSVSMSVDALAISGWRVSTSAIGTEARCDNDANRVHACAYSAIIGVSSE